ncbi:MAG: hypothetical protein ABW187_10275 [Dokdonella sp.]
MAGFTERRQALQDIIAATLVADRWAFSDHPERQQHSLGAGLILRAVVVPLVLVAVVESSPQLPCPPVRTTRCAQRLPRWRKAPR